MFCPIFFDIFFLFMSNLFKPQKLIILKRIQYDLSSASTIRYRRAKVSAKVLLSMVLQDCKTDHLLQVLTGTGMFWSDSGEKGKGQRVVGGNREGYLLYICRNIVGGNFVPGKIEDASCWIPYNNTEHKFETFQTLKIEE
jgi:hypothetical protein